MKEHRNNMTRAMPAASIIVPLGPDEDSWQELLDSLAGIAPATTEVIIVRSDQLPSDISRHLSKICRQYSFRELCSTESNRAVQLNLGAGAARGEVLWFIHADSRIEAAAISKAISSALNCRESIFFCNISFAPQGPALMALNTAGAWLRSHLMKLPFGDQGLCLSKDLFTRLRGFDESCTVGEDLNFILKARSLRIPIRYCGASISTSSRKYLKYGWLTTTARHIGTTFRMTCASGFRNASRRID